MVSFIHCMQLLNYIEVAPPFLYLSVSALVLMVSVGASAHTSFSIELLHPLIKDLVRISHLAYLSQILLPD